MTSSRTAHEFIDLDLDQIDRNPGQPRKHFDPEALAELATSIRSLGLLEPIVVRPVGDRYVIVAGERRWRASQAADLTTVPVRVIDLDEADAYVLSVAENVNRADMTVMEEAEAYAQLQTYGKSVEEIAGLFGKRPHDVAGRILLLQLEPQARSMVESGVMGAGLAWYIAKLRPGNQRVVATRWARGDFDADSAMEFAAALAAAEEQAGFFEMEEPTLEDRAEHAKKARAARSTLDQIERLSTLLGEVAAMDPAELADSLGNDVAARLAAFEHLAKTATRAKNTLRKAKAHSEARTLVVADDAAAS